MSNRINSYGLCVFCLGVILAAGCLPDEDPLDWSADGSIGLLMTDGKLYVVDGKTGALSPSDTDKVSLWPDISNDGKRIAYAVQVKHATLAEGLRALPVEQARMIAKDANSLRDKVLSGILPITDFNSFSDELFSSSHNSEKPLGYVQPYRQWVIRSLCENADEQLARKLGDKALQQGKTAELTSSALIVAALPAIGNGKTITTSALSIVRPRFSPDGQYVAYLVLGPARDEQAHLFVVPLQRGPTAVYVASNVSLGFDWRQDSQALAYLQLERQELMLGALQEQRICDPNGKLLDEVSDNPEMPLAGHHLKGESKQLAGTLVEPLMKVQYGIGGRLFFSSAQGKIPSSNLDEPSYSLFCYDSVTGAVADVLPSRARSELPLGEMVNFFSLSPDGHKVLLPMKKNRLAIYELGAPSFTTPVKEGEEFGEDMPKILPAWKGNDRISFRVSQTSHFLTEEQQKRGRTEIVVLDTAGNGVSLLSGGWPDEAMPKD